MIFSIKQGNYITTAKPTQIGVPQGSILGPYLFNIYINDFPPHPKCQTKLFADDAAILANSKSIGIITAQLQNYINSIIKWCNDWKLDINPKKSQAIIFPPLSNKKFKPQSILKEISIPDSDDPALTLSQELIAQQLPSCKVRGDHLYSTPCVNSQDKWQADLAPKEMAVSDMRNRRHVQPLLTWSTDSSCIPGALTGFNKAGTINDLERSGRPRVQRTQAAIKAIRERIRRYSRRKQKILAKQMSLAPRTVSKIINEDLGLRAFKRRTGHLITSALRDIRRIVKIPLDPLWISWNKVSPRLTRAISPKPWSLGGRFSVCQSWCCGFVTDSRPLVCGDGRRYETTQQRSMDTVRLSPKCAWIKEICTITLHSNRICVGRRYETTQSMDTVRLSPKCAWIKEICTITLHSNRICVGRRYETTQSMDTGKGYGGAVSVLMLESAAKASASMLGTASNYRQSQTFTKVCLDHGAMINESCTPIPHSMRSDVDLHAASPVAQNKQGRVQDLGRGFCPISIIQSPQTSHFATSKQLSILQCNINGLCSTATKIKLEEIMEIAEKQKIQIIALQETKLNEKYNLKYKNYNILRKDRNKEGGGLAFLIKNLYYEDIAINIPNTSDLEAQGIKVYLNQNKTINIFNMYHPPNNKLIDDGTMAQFLTDNTIIVGDLNAKHQLWGCSTPNPRGKILSNLFDDNAFMCLNDGNPTHHSYSYNTAQALDISFSSPDIFHKCKWQILKSIGSDHLPILIEISTKTKTSSIKEKFWNFKKANWNLYQQNTNEDFRKAPTRINDLEQNWLSFKNTIIKAAKVSIPRGNIKKWIPNYTHQAKDIQTLITKRNELQKKYTQNQTNCRTELNIVNAKIKRLYVNMKREKWKQTCENLNPRNPNTKLWHLAKQIDRAQPQTENTNMIKNIDGTPATNDKNAANLLGNSYQISSKIKFEIKDKKVEKKARKIIHDCKNVTSTYNIFHEKINMKELDYALENTDLNKTPGPDGIHGQMISNLGKNGKEKLLDIFNNSWKTGKLPQDWKTATIIPIKKLDKSADDPKNYRPISLTSICCKLMEKIILRRLTYHLDTRNLLPEEQYGFRKGHGTIDQLLFFTQKVKDAQNRKPTNHTIAAFLDLTQAFDKVWKNKLITKLYKHFKIDGKAITWINDFLKNRYIRVKYNGTLSKTFKLYQGLPQGSVLSPTLFTLFIAGIEEKISHKTNIGLFADDIILWSSNTNWKKAERDLNKTLFHLEKFANKHKLEFNPQKSETCLFTTDKKLYKIRPKIILKEQQLQYNKHPKYLGYTLDPEINSSKHIEEVIRKGRDRLKILKYISGREWGADATTLKLTYTSLIRPILEYGYQIYGTASETNLKSLERIQLSAARIITGLRNTCPNDIVLYEADIMPLKDRRSYNLPKYINKIKSYGNKHRTSKYILNWESNLRLKKEGPLHLAKRNEFLKYKVEKNYLAEKISPCKPLQNVIFNATLNEPTNKQYQNPEYLKQLSLEIINNIPKNAITIYTDGSRDELGHTGSGCLIKTTNGIEKMNRRNPDFCSVFRSELIAIYEALKSIRNTNYQDIWILTDSRSAIQHLSHTGELRDKVSRNIIGYLQKLSKTSKIHLQWIPSHVGIEGNEAADVLAKKGTKEPLPQKNKLTFKEIETIAKTKINKNWRIPPKHSWYSGVNPGGALNIRNRQHQTTLTRFRTGHLKPLKIENNNKIYPTCPKCSLVPAAPEHILACIRCTKQDLWERPLLIIKQLEEHELMEFVLAELTAIGRVPRLRIGERPSDMKASCETSRITLMNKQLLTNSIITSARVPLQGYGGAASVLMLESAAKVSASMLGMATNYRQSQTFTKVCLDHGAMINESCTPTPHSMRSDVDLHAASPVAQNKQGRVQDLGRGFCPISIIQSPQTSNFAASKQLSILQCNINGLCSTATKIKLEEIMELAEKQKIQIIALQETKLNEKYNLKYKNYNILRKDRNKEEGGLAFLIKNLYYEDIAINIPNTSDIEAQGIKVYLSQNKTINIFNMWNPWPNVIKLGQNGKERLLDIFKNSWKSGKLPQDWKTATIITIKKLHKSADDPKNYRPISLTSICCKLMEKIILRRLTYHLDTRNLLPEEQYGFRKGHGTIDQLLFFTQKVKDAQNRKPTNHTIAAFLDLTQAFDKVWKNKSELIAIYEALKSIRNTNYQDIWILTDSRSAIQHLSHTGELRDKVSRNIIGYLQKFSKTSKIHLQWIPSHVGIEGNEAADVLAKKGTKEPLPQKNKLTFKEIETVAKTKINKNWRIPPKHSWYSGVNPGGALNIRNRQHQTTLTRFRTGHLKPLKIENNNKIYPTCPKCSLAPAAPEHILACIRCTKQDLWESPLLIIKQLEEHELMEFVNSQDCLAVAIYKDKILEKISLSHPRHLSVYKSELSAIDTALKAININSPSKIIIYSDSRAAIYSLQSCFSSQEPLLKSIAKSVNRLPANSSVTVQWFPAHFGIPGNELADSLAKAGALGLPEARESTTQLDERDLLRTIKIQSLQEWKSNSAHD
ncbi:hypothetical protein LAZ67_7000182 [Cordylochernes scorpioides]|uniref:RNA-directed DNA polymerase from mobile element jockey n=1 Tax=Cordylochernes scorpioides TaxID=51811 RepID=A0ABY6KPB3_9ARAC|nr:hypothetical protein LAZ67_7000182 [Cordylochernes scorpioides]